MFIVFYDYFEGFMDQIEEQMLITVMEVMHCLYVHPSGQYLLLLWTDGCNVK